MLYQNAKICVTRFKTKFGAPPWTQHNIAAILSGKAPARKTIVVVIIILFERIGQYDGVASPIL
jgi:hypothetical protein